MSVSLSKRIVLANLTSISCFFRSLEVQPPDKSPWKQYLTLGEIFKAYGHFQESQIHLRHALELMPDHMGIKQALLDVENIPSSTLHAYTILIILFLVTKILSEKLLSNFHSKKFPFRQWAFY